MTLAALLVLAASAVETAVVSSPQLGTFFSLPQWMPTTVSSARTPGSCDATNMTRRVDETALAAVNACFEGMYEHAYFAHAGQSNVWDVSEYGPTCRGTDKHEFRFALPSGSSEGRFVYDPDTNRVIVTRRLVEYDNLAAVWTSLYARNGRFNVYRPNWWNYNGSFDTIYWASSLIEGQKTNYGTLGEMTPAIDWTAPGVFGAMTNEFAAAAPFVEQFADGAVLKWHSTGREAIPYHAITAVRFLEPPLTGDLKVDEYTDFTNRFENIVGMTALVTNVTDLIHTNQYAIKLGIPTETEGVTVMDEIEGYLGTIGETNDFSAVAGIDQTTVGEYGDAFVWFNCGKSGSSRTPVPNSGIIPTGIAFDAIQRTWTLENELTFNMNRRPDGSFYADPGTGDIEFNTLFVEWVETVTNVTRLVGVDGITNATRRLYADRVAGIGLTLGALDRTFVHLDVPRPSLVTQYVAKAAKDYTASISESTSFSFSGGAWRHHVVGSEFPTLQHTSSASRVSASGSATVTGRYVRYVEDAERGFTLTALLTGTNTLDCANITQDHVGQIVTGRPGDADRFEIYFDSCTIDQFGHAVVEGIVWFFEGSSVLTSQSFTISVSSGPADIPLQISADATTRVEYGSGYTYGDPAWTHAMKKYPGDYSRVSASTGKPKLWSMLGCACLRGDAEAPTTDVLAAPNFPTTHTNLHSSVYKTAKSEYMTPSALMTAYQATWTELRTKCDEVLAAAIGGADRTNPLSVLGSLESNIPRALAHVKMEGGAVILATFRFRTVGGQGDRLLDSLLGYFDNGAAVVDTLGYRTPEGYVTEPGTVPVAAGNWEYALNGRAVVEDGYAPEAETAYGGKVGGKIDSWSRVDWDWKALKRTKRN